MKRSTFAIALVLGAALLALPALAFAAASAEQPAAPAAKKDVVLKMWGGVPPEAGPQKAVEAFNKQYADKGITIEYERFVNDDQGNLKLETYLLSGSDIDVYISYTRTALLKRAQGNMAMDLTQLIKKIKSISTQNLAKRQPSWLLTANITPYLPSQRIIMACSSIRICSMMQEFLYLHHGHLMNSGKSQRNSPKAKDRPRCSDSI